jgi:catalase
VGTNYQQVPVNQPRCPVMHYQRDGAMSVGYRGSSTNYYPNMRQLCHFFRADADYGQRIAKALNVPIDAAMLQQNQQDNPQPVSV